MIMAKNSMQIISPCIMTDILSIALLLPRRCQITANIQEQKVQTTTLKSNRQMGWYVHHLCLDSCWQ